MDHLNKILEELKAQIAIENRKKLLIKDKLDQAFLRGASAICIEALTMSQSNMTGIIVNSLRIFKRRYFWK